MAVFLGILPEMRQGIAGSTAVDWANDFDGRLSVAVKLVKQVDVVVISLFGNDTRHFADDGQITITEVTEAIQAMRRVVSSFRSAKQIVLITYADPYFGKDIRSTIGVRVINSAVRWATLGCQNVSIFDSSAILLPEHFDGIDFHPTENGHRVLADALCRYISTL